MRRTEPIQVGHVAPRAPNSETTANDGTHGVAHATSTACGCVFSPRKMEVLSTPLLIVSWICRVVAAVILLQTLYFKFTGAEESVYIFTKLGMEPWGRFASGVAELFAALLLLFPRTVWAGALLAAGVMVGAIGSHFTKLGIEVKDDGGLLFALAWIVFVCALATAYIHRRQLPVIGQPN